MKLGNRIYQILILFFFFFNFSKADEKISSTPLINIEQIKPSFEELANENEKIPSGQNLKEKKIIKNLNESIQFGQLKIKILKCGKVKMNDRIDSVAYMQVKDLTKNQNEQVFIFNGWTFASDSSLTPFDHAIYDIKLLNCNKA